jgi:hypothetical protein
MYLRPFSALVLGTLSHAHFCFSYAITTTILLDPYKFSSTKVAIYEPVSSPVNIDTSNTAIYEQAYSPIVAYTGSSHKTVYSLEPTATTPPAWSNNTLITSIGGADASLLPLPLSTNQSAALFSLLNLITSIPDEVLQAGNASVHAFFTNISSCLTNQTKAVEQAVSLAVPALENAVTSLGGRLTSAVVPLATTLAGDITSFINPAVTVAASAVESGARGVANHASAMIPAVTSLAAPIESIAINIAQDIDSFFKNRREILKKLKERSQLGDKVNQLSKLDACLSTSLDNNSIFKVGDCAAELAKLAFPLARIARVKELVGDVGGAAKAVKDLVEAKSVGEAVAAGGSQVLDLVKEVSRVNHVVKACKFLV